MNRQRPNKSFRSMTVHIGNRKVRTMVIAMTLTVGILFLFVCAIAVQLMAVNNNNSFAARMLHSVTNQSLNTIMSQEIPVYASANPDQIGTPKQPDSNWTSMLFYLFTDIDVEHPETMLGGSIAAVAVSNFKPLTDEFVEPPGEDNLPDSPDRTQQPASPPEKEQVPNQSDGKPIVYIYHTHNRESYLPELNGETEPNKAYDKDKNITLVGEHLFKSLKEKNIASIQTKNDYWFKGDVKNEYDLSRKTVQDVLGKNSSIKFVFDLHRDSLSRDKTTVKINNKDAARVSFIVGGSNPNFKQNQEFALKFHGALQKLYPGLSRGAFTNLSQAYDTKYNQDLLPNSVLIEIGGPENSLQEAYYTAELLANTIANLVKE